MMVAIPVKVKALDLAETKTSKFFGKAPYVLLISPDGSTEVLQNEFNSGKKLAEELVKRGVKTLITNHLGQKAYEILSSHHINILYNEASSTVQLSLDAYKSGALKKFEVAMIHGAKHRKKGDCSYDRHEDGECCGHEHDGKHSHGLSEECCEKEGGKKREGRGRCCQGG